MSFSNLYYKRATATPKACFICFKPTTTVLATASSTDFVYTCPGHLSDRGFATIVQDDIPSKAQKPQLSTDEIAKIKEEWEEKQKRKKEKEKEGKKDDKDDKDKDSDEKKVERKSPSASLTPPPLSGSSTPKHERYTLHRDYFAMRLAEHRKRRQTAQAKDLAPKLPGAPRGPL